MRHQALPRGQQPARTSFPRSIDTTAAAESAIDELVSPTGPAADDREYESAYDWPDWTDAVAYGLTSAAPDELEGHDA